MKSLNLFFVYFLYLSIINLSLFLYLSIFSSVADSYSHKTKQTKKIPAHSRHISLNILSWFLDFGRALLEKMC